MIDWGATSALVRRGRARQQWLADLGQNLARDQEQGEAFQDRPGGMLTAPLPSLGTERAKASPRPSAAPTASPRRAYGFRPAATFQASALGQTAPVAVATRAMRPATAPAPLV